MDDWARYRSDYMCQFEDVDDDKNGDDDQDKIQGIEDFHLR